MLKRIRWRVIVAAMLAFSSVITLLAVLVNVVNYVVVTQNADQTLNYILQYEKDRPDDRAPENPPAGPFRKMPNLEANYMTRFFVVRLASDGTILSNSTEYIASIDNEDAAAYAEQVLQKDVQRGYIDEYRFLKTEIRDSTAIIFLNTMREQQFMTSLRTLTVAVTGVSLVLVFILILLFSNRAIQPILNNIQRQKQFITDVSHELKTPLTSISTSIDVITLEHGSDEWTDNIRNQTGRMSRLVSELVMLSRLDEEISLPDKEPFSLSNAAWEIIEVYQPQAKALEKKLLVEIENNISFFGEKNAVQEMLSVLLDNAIRYSDLNGEIRFSMEKKRNRIRIEVFNTCHFDELPDTDRLFDRFYRPDSSRNTDTGGTGIGLAIARAVAEAHDGTITAECADGRTMTIRVIL